MNKKQLIYCAGNNREIHDLNLYFLINNYETVLCESREKFNTRMRERNPDSIIIDSEILDNHGILMVRNLKCNLNGPLIIVGERSFSMKHIELIDAGADDYMSRRDEPAVILARLNAICRRMNYEKSGEIEILELQGSRLSMNENTRQAFVDNREVGLTFREWNVLLYLVRNRKRAVSRKELLEYSLEYQFDGYNRILDSYIRNIRRKLNVSGCIKTIRGFGYHFSPASLNAAQTI